MERVTQRQGGLQAFLFGRPCALSRSHWQRREDRGSGNKVIGIDDIDGILNSPRRDVEGLPAWCARNGVEETVLRRLVAIYGFDKLTAAVAVDAFRLGCEARREDGSRDPAINPTAISPPSWNSVSRPHEKALIP